MRPWSQRRSGKKIYCCDLVERSRGAARAAEGKPRTEYIEAGALDVELTTHPISRAGVRMGTLELARDTSAIASAWWSYWRGAIFGLVVQVAAIVVLTLLLLRWSLAAPMAHLARWMRDLRVDSPNQQPVPLGAGIFQPLAREVAQLASSLHVVDAPAANEEIVPVLPELLLSVTTTLVSVTFPVFVGPASRSSAAG